VLVRRSAIASRQPQTARSLKPAAFAAGSLRQTIVLAP
jgi:hypothetical protein